MTTFQAGTEQVLGLTEAADSILAAIERNFPNIDHQHQQALCLAEEVGEFIGAYRRWRGMARRPGSRDDVDAELADVVIAAYVTAAALGTDLDQEIQRKLVKIFSRGWKEPR